MVSIKGKSVVFAGRLPGFSRKQAEFLATKLGAHVSDILHSGTDYLVAGNRAGPAVEEARRSRVKILDATAWARLATSVKLSLKLVGERVVFTGRFQCGSREKCEWIAAFLGATVEDRVTDDTTMIVAGQRPGPKLAAAKKRSITVLDEAAWSEILSNSSDATAYADRASAGQERCTITVFGTGFTIKSAKLTYEEGRDCASSGFLGQLSVFSKGVFGPSG